MRRRLLLFFPISLGMRRRLLFFSGLRYKENLFRCKHGFLQLNFLFESFNEYSMILLLVLVSAGVVREGLGAVAALMHLASIRLVLVLELVVVHSTKAFHVATYITLLFFVSHHFNIIGKI